MRKEERRKEKVEEEVEVVVEDIFASTIQLAATVAMA